MNRDIWRPKVRRMRQLITNSLGYSNAAAQREGILVASAPKLLPPQQLTPASRKLRNDARTEDLRRASVVGEEICTFEVDVGRNGASPGPKVQVSGQIGFLESPQSAPMRTSSN